jgi:hypothetical protein
MYFEKNILQSDLNYAQKKTYQFLSWGYNTVSVPVEYFRMKNCTSFTFNENLFAKMKNAGQ